MIEDAEKAGKLRPGMDIVEGSTGNTATALAFVGGVKGYKVRLFIPSKAASEERLRPLNARRDNDFRSETIFPEEAHVVCRPKCNSAAGNR